MSDAWFKFYPSDWLSGTRAFTLAEAGLYVTLIAMMYETGQPISMDRKRLARMCGTTPKAFEKALTALLEAGKIVTKDGGLWSNRVQKEQEKRRYITEKASQSATIRWEKDQQNQQPCDATASKPHMRTGCLPESQKPETRTDTIVSVDIPDKPDPVSEAVSIYHEVCSPAGLPRVQKLTAPRKASLRKRLADCGGLDGWRDACHRVAASAFLCGENDRGWKADFDFLVTESKFTKLMEGGYDRSDNARAAKPADRQQANTDRRRNAWLDAIDECEGESGIRITHEPASGDGLESLSRYSGEIIDSG